MQADSCGGIYSRGRFAALLPHGWYIVRMGEGTAAISVRDGITTQEAARRLGVTRHRVRKIVADGHLKAQRFGMLWLLSAADVDRLIRDRLARRDAPGRFGRPPNLPGVELAPKAALKGKK